MRANTSFTIVIAGICLTRAALGANPPAFWQFTVVDSTANAGAYSSMVTLPTGFPAVAYVGATAAAVLKYAWEDATGWHVQPVSEFAIGAPSLAILLSGDPAIAYTGFGGITYAQRSPAGWQNTTLTVPGSVDGANPSLVVLPSGQPAFSFSDGVGANPANLRYAWFDGQTWQSELVASFQDTQFTGITSTSLAILPSGAPVVACTRAFHLPHGGRVSVSLGPAPWQTQLIDEVFDPLTASMYSASLRVLPSGRPALIYAVEQGSTSPLRYAEFDGQTWVTSQAVDNVSGLGASLAVLPSGDPAVALPHLLDLALSERTNNQWHVQRIGPRPTNPAWCSLTILGGGEPAISFEDGSVLKVAAGFSLGDLNCDGAVNFGDINPFVLALSDPAGYAAQYPACSRTLADCNQDGTVDFGDINPFVALLTQ